jgi:DNA-binding MarR family transcriptional regulator
MERFMDSLEFFYRFGRAIYKIDATYDEYGKNSKIYAPNYLWILYALNDGEEHSQSEICREWLIPRSTINTVVKNIEEKGYIELVHIKGTRRELHIRLTASGKEYVNCILGDLYEKEKRIYDTIENPQAFLAQLENLAEKVISHI